MPTVTYRDPSGQTVTTDLQNAPPQVQTLYNQNYLQPQAQLQQTQAGAAVTSAEIPGAVASSQTRAIQAQQAGALQGLQKDLQGKMTLKSALSKYTALGMTPDEVFTQYLNTSPWGMPNETPTQLINMGINSKTLGDIGTPGSFMDRYNTKNAILGLRDLQDKFHKTNALSQIENAIGLPTGGANAAAAYNAGRSLYTEHLSSLIPGASGASGDIAKMASAIPDLGAIGNYPEYSPGKADAQFQSVEDQLLKTKGYSTSDLGLGSNSVSTTQTKTSPTTSGGLLSTLLTNAGKDVSGMIQGEQQRQQVYGPGFGGAVASTVAGIPGQVKQLADIVENPQQQFTQHPVSSSLSVLGALLGGKSLLSGGGEVPPGENAGVESAAQDVFSKAPNKLQQMFTPGKAKNVIGDIRDTIVSQADQANKPISGDTIAQGIRAWANQAKLGNLPDADAIEQAAISAEKQYAGKTFKPSDVYGIYKGIEKGYTGKGMPKSSTASYIDRGVQDVLQNTLNDAAPGFNKANQLFSQTYAAEKSPMKKFTVNALRTGAGLAGAGYLAHLFEPFFHTPQGQ